MHAQKRIVGLGNTSHLTAGETAVHNKNKLAKDVIRNRLLDGKEKLEHLVNCALYVDSMEERRSAVSAIAKSKLEGKISALVDLLGSHDPDNEISVFTRGILTSLAMKGKLTNPKTLLMLIKYQCEADITLIPASEITLDYAKVVTLLEGKALEQAKKIAERNIYALKTADMEEPRINHLLELVKQQLSGR